MLRDISLKNITLGLWVALFPLLAVLLQIPVNSRALRMCILLVGVGIIVGSFTFFWQRRWVVRSLTGIYFLIGVFLLLPGHPPENRVDLQKMYVASMTGYTGVPYVWGGETRFGLDCSGLVRRGFEDTLLKNGAMTLNPFLIRRAIDLWWNDTTANEIGKGYEGRTIHVTSCSSLNALDPALILPGDMAVTEDGVHVMAYLGSNQWIGADPGEMKVTIFTTPNPTNGWFSCPINIVRWSILDGSYAYRENYRKMFGPIIVPTYPGFGEPEAPPPLIYILANMKGDISALRHPLSGASRWSFEELDSEIFRDGKAEGKDASFVIAADKNLPRDAFFKLIKEMREKSGRKKLWIQVWGMHPYPLQIPIDVSNEEPDAMFEDCQNLQEIVTRICDPPAKHPPARPKSQKPSAEE